MKLKPCDARIEALRTLARKSNAQGILLSDAHNTAWLLGGRTHVGLAGARGVCDVLVSESGVYVIASNIEGRRLNDEEIKSSAVKSVEYPWAQTWRADALAHELCPGNLLRDADCEYELLKLRTTLLPDQILEMHDNCARIADVMRAAISRIKPNMTETQAAGQLANAAYEFAMEPIVVLAAGGERLMNYRHPIPSENALDKYLMLSLGARKNGMYASITRTLCFGNADADMLTRQHTVNTIAARTYSATRPGLTCAQAYEVLAQAYEDMGVADEINRHHQGGLGGFQAREVKITAETQLPICAGQVFAWNPSVAGYKNEDMLLIGETRNHVLTLTPDMPYETIHIGDEAWNMPKIIEL